MGIHTKQYQWFRRMDVSSWVVISTEGEKRLVSL